MKHILFDSCSVNVLIWSKIFKYASAFAFPKTSLQHNSFSNNFTSSIVIKDSIIFWNKQINKT